MPRVHFVKKARKDNPVAKKGESYYWWKFRFGGKRYSTTYPRRSQLTQSAYFGAVYDLMDMVGDYHIEPGDEDACEALRDDVYGEIENIQSECQDSLDNMPESLQYAPTGELLQERIDACDNAMSELDSFEEPQQWQDVRDQQEEHDQWENEEPDVADFDTEDEFKERKLEWLDDEPTVDDFEDADKDIITDALEGMLV